MQSNPSDSAADGGTDVAVSDETDAQTSSPPARRTGFAAGLALLVAIFALVVAGAIGYFGWSRVQAPLTDTTDRLRSHSADITALTDRLAVAEERLAQVPVDLNRLDQRRSQALDTALGSVTEEQASLGDEVRILSDRQETIEAALQGMRSYLGQSRRDWLLNEAEYLLAVAGQRLALAGDVGTAIAALEFADDSLQQLDDARLTPVRRAIAAELRDLRGVAPLDIAGIDLAVRSLAEGAVALPLAGFQRSVATPRETGASGWWRRARLFLEGIVNIQPVDSAPEPLLPPGQRFFLVQNLALKLEAARLALLHRDEAVFRDRLREADSLIASYFDPRDAAVRAARASIAAWLELDIALRLPPIGAALDSLRGLREATSVLEADPR